MKPIPDFLMHIPSGSDSSDVAAKYGAIGDFIGGYWGTLINLVGLAITIIFVYRTFSLTRKTENRSKVYDIFSEMVRTHDSITDSFAYAGQSGRDVFRTILREFSSVYKIVSSVAATGNVPWSINEKIDIAYTFVSFDPTWAAVEQLDKYDPQAVKDISNGVARLRDKATTMNKVLLRGHQGRLSNYYRNLYGIFSFIDASPLDKNEKMDLAKVVRAKLSNHEQGLLALNIVSHFGQAWEEDGLLGRYQIIKNIPKKFFTFDAITSIDALFPYVVYEWKSKSVKMATREFRSGKSRFLVYIIRDR